MQTSTIAFTICANNYLAHASTLAKSFKAHHPDVKFAICLVDKPNSSIDYTSLGADEVIWVADVLEVDLNLLGQQYNIAELCTVVKPDLIARFFDLGWQVAMYIDPDIQVFSLFEEVFESLKTKDMVLTPHMCSPTADTGHPIDKDIMRTGVYNLGFLAIKKSDTIEKFVQWWDKRVKQYGYHDLPKGYFYDQIWLSFATCFLDDVAVLRHLGYNAANWNLHERDFSYTNSAWLVNTKVPLRFYHFSHYKMENEPAISTYNENYNLENRPDIVPLFKAYKQALIDNAYHTLKPLDFVYGKVKVNKMEVGGKSEKAKANRLQTAFNHAKKALRAVIYGY